MNPRTGTVTTNPRTRIGMLQTQLETYFSGTGNEPPTSAYPLKCNIFPPWIPMLTSHIQVVSKTLERWLINCSLETLEHK